MTTVFLPMILMTFFVMKTHNFKESFSDNSTKKSNAEVANNQNIQNSGYSRVKDSAENKLSFGGDKLAK